MYPSIDLVLFWNSIACVVCNGLHGEKECTPMNMYPELKRRENKESHKCEHKKKSYQTNDRVNEQMNAKVNCVEQSIEQWDLD